MVKGKSLPAIPEAATLTTGSYETTQWSARWSTTSTVPHGPRNGHRTVRSASASAATPYGGKAAVSTADAANGPELAVAKGRARELKLGLSSSPTLLGSLRLWSMARHVILTDFGEARLRGPRPSDASALRCWDCWGSRAAPGPCRTTPRHVSFGAQAGRETGLGSWHLRCCYSLYPFLS